MSGNSGNGENGGNRENQVNPLNSDKKKAGAKAEKDIQEILLEGSKVEQQKLLDGLDKKNLSVLEKKVYRCLLQYKLEQYDEAKTSIEDLILDINGLQAQQQAKVHLLRAQIYEKLQQINQEQLKQEILNSLENCCQIFRQRKYHKVKYEANHYLIQIADMYLRQECCEEAEDYYEMIFTKKDFRYPNDWAICIQAYLKYFDCRIKRRLIVEASLFENCKTIMIDKGFDRNYLHKLRFYYGINYLLQTKGNNNDSIRNLDECIQQFKAAEANYTFKNKIKRNHKMIYFVDQFINVDENIQSSYSRVIKIVPIFLKLGYQFKEIVKNRLKLLHDAKKQWEENRKENEDKYIEERDRLLGSIKKKTQNIKIQEYLKKKIEVLAEQLEIENEKEKLRYIKINEQEKSIRYQNRNWENKELLELQRKRVNYKLLREQNRLQNLKKDLQNYLSFAKVLQLKQIPFKPQEFNVYDKFQESIQDELQNYKNIEEKQLFKRTFTLDDNLIKQILDFLPVIEQNQNEINNQELIEKQGTDNQTDNDELFSYCCYEFIQLERFNEAETLLKKISDKLNLTILSLLLFSNLPFKAGREILIQWKKQISKQPMPQGLDLSCQKICVLRAARKLKSQQLNISKEVIEIKFLFANMYFYLRDKMIIRKSQMMEIFKNYTGDHQGCLFYLVDDLKNNRFYDPHVYEFKNIIYDIIYLLKNRNSQAIFLNGFTYTDILNETKGQWRLKD